MKIYLSTTDWFKRYISGAAEIELDLVQGAPAVEAVLIAGIPVEEVGFITVNNAKVNEWHVLNEGDKLKVYPVIIGG